MNFEWKLEKNKKLTFEDKVHNLACFEIVLNILRMKTKAGEPDVSEEIQALCFFALECMFKEDDLDNIEFFKTIMSLKEKKVTIFKDNILKGMGIPKEMANTNEIGEA